MDEYENALAQYRNLVKDMPKAQAISELKECLYYLEIGYDYLPWDTYNACKKVLKEVENYQYSDTKKE